jgi:hypothetical protein
MSNDTHLINVSNDPTIDNYVMERSIVVECTEHLDNATKEKRVELSGQLNDLTVSVALDLMREVLGE